MKTIETQVAIVGGGVAGGSLACALSHRNIHSILLERRKGCGDLNRGDGMQPRSLEIMETWGLLTDFVQAGTLPSYGNEVHHPILGKLLEVDLNVVKTRHPYILNLPHPQIEESLLKYSTERGHCQVLHGDVRGVLFENGRAVAVKAVVNGEEVIVKAPVIASADGAQSYLRKTVGIKAPFQAYSHDMLVLQSKRPAWFSGRLRTRVFLHQEGATVFLALPDDKVRIVVLIESKTGAKWRHLSEPELRKQLARRFPPLADMELERHGEHIYRIQKMHAEHYASKGIVLLGDAAHVTHPAAGQGMNIALHDAETLAAELYRVFQGEGSFDEAYAAYERIRRPLNQSVINRANFMAWLLWSPSTVGFAVRTFYSAAMRFLLPFAYQRLTQSLAWGISGIQPQRNDVRQNGSCDVIQT